MKNNVHQASVQRYYIRVRALVFCADLARWAGNHAAAVRHEQEFEEARLRLWVLRRMAGVGS